MIVLGMPDRVSPSTPPVIPPSSIDGAYLAPMSLTVVFVCAHPDDDTFGIARSMALHADDTDLRFVLVHATDGEGGEIAPDVDVSPADLGSLRRREAEASWETLGRVPDRHEWFGLPDGGLDRVDFDGLVSRVWEVLVEEEPDVVATLGPDGVTGHPDHVTIGRATSLAFMRGVASGSEGFRRLLHGCIPQSQIDRWNANRSAAGHDLWDSETMYHIRGVPDETVGITVDTRGVAPRAVAALRAHQSQWSPAHMPVDDEYLVRSLRTEDWVIAWPSRTPDTPVLTDILEGLRTLPE
jgi:LmbE family N-acetylglucosaminyl deacetylase